MRRQLYRTVHGWVQPDGNSTDGFLITLLDDIDRNGVVVALTAESGTPEERARSMAEYLMSTPASQWPVIRRIRDEGRHQPADANAAAWLVTGHPQVGVSIGGRSRSLDQALCSAFGITLPYKHFFGSAEEGTCSN
jgi:hypothetical protein